MKKNKEIIQFLLLCFGLNFSMAGLFFALGLDYKGIEGIILAFLYMLMPALSAFIIEKINKKKNIKKRLLISFKPNKWFLVAWLITPLIAAATFGISLLLPEVSFSANMDGMFERYANILSPEQIEEMKNSFQNMPIHPFWITLLQGLFAGITINAIAGFGEELGWRGFLLRQLNQQSFIKASLLIGFIWGIWHSPIILMGHNYPQHPEIGVLMMTIWCILLSPLFLYITLKSKSVIAASILHGTLNGTSSISLLLIKGGNDLTVGMSGMAGFISLSIILLIIYLYDSYISKEKLMSKKIQI